MASRIAWGIVIVAAAGIAALDVPPLWAAADGQPRFTISGRVEDPHNLRPAEAMLSVAFERDGVGYGVPVPMTRSGDFATHALSAGTYVLTVVRTPNSKLAPPTVVGLTITRIVNEDVTGLRVTIQPDMSLKGRFRMAPGVAWPASIVVTSCLAPEGTRLASCLAAEGAPGGTFVLRNAYGPRLLNVSYSGPQAARPRILLDGRDITRVPTDFSAHPGATLEIVLEPALTISPASR